MHVFLHYNKGMAEKEQKRGAPTKPPEVRKDHVVQIRLTSAKRQECERANKAVAPLDVGRSPGSADAAWDKLMKDRTCFGR